MGEQKPKYLNTSDTVVFKKSANLFALNLAKNEGSRRLILAEGYMEASAKRDGGLYPNPKCRMVRSLSARPRKYCKAFFPACV